MSLDFQQAAARTDALIRRKQRLMESEPYCHMRATGHVQPGENGPWLIDQFEVTDRDMVMQYQDMFRSGRFAPPGTYTRLTRNRALIMSDTPDELQDHVGAYHHATGRVLINGLGLGCVLRGVLSKPEVTHVDVVEISQDLIDLVGPFYDDSRVTFHCDDAFTITWPRGTRWNAVWNDVWSTLSSANLSNVDQARPGTYAALHRRYGRRTDWMGSWGFEFLKARSRRGW